jgi:hypothetical protein
MSAEFDRKLEEQLATGFARVRGRAIVAFDPRPARAVRRAWPVAPIARVGACIVLVILAAAGAAGALDYETDADFAASLSVAVAAFRSTLEQHVAAAPAHEQAHPTPHANTQHGTPPGKQQDTRGKKPTSEPGDSGATHARATPATRPASRP